MIGADYWRGYVVLCGVFLTTAIFGACGEEVSGETDTESMPPDHPEGWSEETNGPDAFPSHDIVFRQDTVQRLDVEIASADWTRMLEDMTELAGEFGTGGGMPGGVGGDIPPEALEACKDQSTEDTCEIDAMGAKIEGVCVEIGGMGLICMPNQLAGDPKACEDKEEDDECTIALGPEQFEGTCVVNDEGVLVCKMQQGPGGDQGTTLLADDPMWVPCTVRFEDKIWQFVGVRFKGNSTLTQTWGAGSYKLPFKLDFDQFEDDHPEILDQRFYGFKRVAFANNAMDSSYLRDKVAGDLFREGGVPAPRRAFYRIYFDIGDGPTYFGLYTMAEIPGRPMFLTQFGDKGGNLYKPDQGAATWKNSLPVNEDSFPKKTNELEADWSDVEASIAALHADRADLEKWRGQLEAVFDVDGFLRWLAINSVIQDWDTYGNLPHNYYLYGDPTQYGRLTWIPWDHNMALSDNIGLMPPLSLDMSNVASDWPLIRFLLDDPKYQQAYWSHVAEFTDGTFRADATKARLQSEHDLIAPYIADELPDYTVLSSPDAFASSLTDLFDHVDKRHRDVAEALNSR